MIFRGENISEQWNICGWRYEWVKKTRKGEFMRGKIVTTTNIPTSRMPIKNARLARAAVRNN